MVGEAFTLRNIPAREDLDHIGVYDNPEHPQRKAIEIAPPGSVLVIDCREDARSASAGGILVRRLEVRGVAGLVTDGGLRDTPEISQRPFPVYCKAPSAPISLITQHAVESNVPVACGGVAVFPNDVISVDQDGAVLIPAAMLDEVVAASVEQERLEGWIMSQVDAGAALPGLYPPNDDNKARYQAWVKGQNSKP
jgi:regulator of RNase E activity RraA